LKKITEMTPRINLPNFYVQRRGKI
jgi:hypothetical protein